MASRRFNTILVETVGVGQSETAVADMVRRPRAVRVHYAGANRILYPAAPVAGFGRDAHAVPAVSAVVKTNGTQVDMFILVMPPGAGECPCVGNCAVATRLAGVAVWCVPMRPQLGQPEPAPAPVQGEAECRAVLSWAAPAPARG